jgi:hypothetical protein
MRSNVFVQFLGDVAKASGRRHKAKPVFPIEETHVLSRACPATTCRSAANAARLFFERSMAARRRGRSPWRRGIRSPFGGREGRSSAATG